MEGIQGASQQGRDDSASSLEGLGFAEPEAEDLEGAYKRELGPLQIGTFDSSLPRAYNRSKAYNQYILAIESLNPMVFLS